MEVDSAISKLVANFYLLISFKDFCITILSSTCMKCVEMLVQGTNLVSSMFYLHSCRKIIIRFFQYLNCVAFYHLGL